MCQAYLLVALLFCAALGEEPPLPGSWRTPTAAACYTPPCLESGGLASYQALFSCEDAAGVLGHTLEDLRRDIELLWKPPPWNHNTPLAQFRHPLGTALLLLDKHNTTQVGKFLLGSLEGRCEGATLAAYCIVLAAPIGWTDGLAAKLTAKGFYRTLIAPEAALLIYWTHHRNLNAWPISYAEMLHVVQVQLDGSEATHALTEKSFDLADKLPGAANGLRAQSSGRG